MIADLLMLIPHHRFVLEALRTSLIDIHPNAAWVQNGITIAGGNGEGNRANQLNYPRDLYIDENQAVYVADRSNHRIMKWVHSATSGQIVAGGNGEGNRANQLNCPWDVIVDEERDNLLICDFGNNRLVRWPRRNGTTKGETMISNIACTSLTLDENDFLYVVDGGKHEVRRYRMGSSEGKVVAGGNGKGNRLDQFSLPSYVFVDQDRSVYVSDYENHRVMKWEEDAKQGIIVAGKNGKGSGLTQLYGPRGVFVDNLGTVYVVDQWNHRIIRWPTGSTQGSVIAGGNGFGGKPNQLSYPVGLLFDQYRNLYVVDKDNNRVQKFSIK